MDGGLAPSSANNRTLLRRLQRKHSQHSYYLLKHKLLTLVRPMPETAIAVADLESFRATLFSSDRRENLTPSTPVDDSPAALSSLCCNWCGTWIPLPMSASIAIKSHPEASTLEDPDAEDLDVDVEGDIKIPELDGAEDSTETIGSNNDNIGAIIHKVSYMPDMFEYLTGTPMLCEVVSLMRGGDIGQKYDQCLRSQRAAALRARSVGRCDSLSWLAGSQVTSSQYSTDPSTGECKTQ